MKKLITILFAALCIYSFIASETFEYEFTMPTIEYARDLGMGSAYVTDTTTYFSFLSNPASLGFTGDKTLFPTLNTRLAGPLNLIPQSLESLRAGNFDVIEVLSKTLSESKGINAAFNIVGPLNFGSIKKGFGWGIFNETYTSFDIPSLISSTFYAGNETLVRLGYGYALKLPVPITISVGLSTDLVNRIEGLYTLKTSEMMSLMGGEEFSFASLIMPVYTSFGYGLDAGITFKLFNVVSISYVWDDFFYGVYTQKSDLITKIINKPAELSSYTSADSTKTVFGTSKKMTAGIGVEIPLADISKNLISSWIVMVDCNDLLSVFANNPAKRNPVLEFSAGTELVLHKTIILRFGIDEMYPAAGIGIRLGAFNIDASIYGQELGREPGSRPQLNTAFSIGFYK